MFSRTQVYGLGFKCYLRGLTRCRLHPDIAIDLRPSFGAGLQTIAGSEADQDGPQSKPGKRSRKRVRQSAGSIRHVHPLERARRALRALKETSGLNHDNGIDAQSQLPTPGQEANNYNSLQLSPLMDPQLLASRSKWKQPKLPPGPETPFEQALAANPFAQMLASPSRMCSITELRVPSALLRPFTLRQDPSDGTYWQLPRDLDPRPLGSVAAAVAPPDENLSSEGYDSGATRSRHTATYLSNRLASTWVANTARAMDHMNSGARSKRRRRSNPTITPRWKAGLSLSTIKHISVREQNGALVQDLLRRRCARELAVLAQGEDASSETCLVNWLVPSSLQEAVQSLEQILDAGTAARNKERQLGVVLWLGTSGDNTAAASEQKERFFGSVDAPVHHPIVRLGNGAVPALDIETLLGPECLVWLRAQHALFRAATALVVKFVPESREAVRWLWSMQLYGSTARADAGSSKELAS